MDQESLLYLSVIMGNIKEHDGSVFINRTVGYLPQNFEVHEEKLAISHCIYNSGDEELINFFEAKSDGLFSPGWYAEFKARGGHFLLKYFAQLGLNESILSRNMSNLSGGEKTKIHLHY